MAYARIQVRVPFSDVDSSGRIHFTAMLRYMENAEHELMRSIGFPYTTVLQEMAFPRVHVSCDYAKAIRYDDRLTIEARTEKVGKSSWTITFNALNTSPTGQGGNGVATEDNIAAHGQMTIVAMNPHTEKSQPLSSELYAALVAD
jgi:acyl-CoA thioester hydrolase